MWLVVQLSNEIRLKEKLIKLDGRKRRNER